MPDRRSRTALIVALALFMALLAVSSADKADALCQVDNNCGTPCHSAFSSTGPNYSPGTGQFSGSYSTTVTCSQTAHITVTAVVAGTPLNVEVNINNIYAANVCVGQYSCQATVYWRGQFPDPLTETPPCLTGIGTATAVLDVQNSQQLATTGSPMATCVLPTNYPDASDLLPDDTYTALDAAGISEAPLVLPSLATAPDINAVVANTQGGVPISPSGCVGRSDFAHHSVTNPDTIDGKTYTNCRVTVPYIYARGQLWKREFWGWDRTGDRNSNQAANGSTVRAIAISNCRNGVWRLTAYHEVVDRDGGTYSAHSDSAKQGITDC